MESPPSGSIVALLRKSTYRNPRTGTFLELPQKRDTHDFIFVPVLGEF